MNNQKQNKIEEPSQDEKDKTNIQSPNINTNNQLNEKNKEQETTNSKEQNVFYALLIGIALNIISPNLPESLDKILSPILSIIQPATLILAIYALATFKNSRRIKIVSIIIIVFTIISMIFAIMFLITCYNAFKGCANA